MGLDVDVGWHSVAGPKKENEDFAAAAAPAGAGARGVIAAVADGVSAGGRGGEASRTTVLGLLQDYFATPETWETSSALDRLIAAQNGWLAAGNRHRAGQPGGGAMTTLTALVLRGHGYTLAHVGDSRAWLLRGGSCEQLTHDHAFDHPDMRHLLTRALGLDDAVRIDYEQGELRAGDVFVLTTDGVHGVTARKRIAAHAQSAREAGAQVAAQALVEEAVRAGTRDDASALVLHVRELAGTQLEDALRRGRALAPAPRLKPGDLLDGYAIEAVLADTGVHRLYRAREIATSDTVAIKALHEARANDAAERAMLAHEAWLGLRMAEQAGAASPGGFVAVREPAGASAFYLVFDWHEGRTLEEMLRTRQAFGIAQVVEGTRAIARALGRLHRNGIVHRDIKPSNLHLGADGLWRILDLGAAVSGRESAEHRELHAGTPSYMNPEQWERGDGAAAVAGPATDLFALGVTLYQWLTGHLPYGDVEPFQLARYRRDPRAPSRLRPDVPVWLDHIVLKAVARDPRRRFETAEELVLALERGAARPLPPVRATPLLARDAAAAWKLGLAVSVLLNVLLLVWLLFLPR